MSSYFKFLQLQEARETRQKQFFPSYLEDYLDKRFTEFAKDFSTIVCVILSMMVGGLLLQVLEWTDEMKARMILFPIFATMFHLASNKLTKQSTEKNFFLIAILYVTSFGVIENLNRSSYCGQLLCIAVIVEIKTVFLRFT